MGTVNSLYAAFVHDHRVTEEQLTLFRESVKEGRWSQLEKEVAVMIEHIQLHIDVEEGHVYPFVETIVDHHPDLSLTLTILKKRHQEIPGYLLEMKESIIARSIDESLDNINFFKRILVDHHRTEEKEIFPLFSRDGELAAHAGIGLSSVLEINDDNI